MIGGIVSSVVFLAGKSSFQKIEVPYYPFFPMEGGHFRPMVGGPRAQEVPGGPWPAQARRSRGL